MRIKILCSLLVLISCMSCQSQNNENSLLWKISGNNIENDSYLFGTVHVTCDTILKDKVIKALGTSNQVVFEVDIDAPDTQTDLMKHLYFKENKTLSDFVTESDYAIIDSLFTKNMGVSVKLFENMKPYFINANLYPMLLSCQPQSIEGLVMKKAKEEGMEILGLETVDEQMEVFNKIPSEAFLSDLIRTAKDNLEYDKKTYASSLVAYENEDINRLLEYQYDKNYKAISNYVKALIYDRNKKWIPKILEFSKNSSTFFAFGAAHLAGDHGVIKLLREEGYTVVPVY